MKKIYTYLATIIVAMTVLTSCNQDAWDREDARTLDGTWTGYIDVYYADRWGWTGDTYRTSMCFIREDAYGGWGYEADYDTGYYNEAYSEFSWEVVNGVIRISYAAPGWNPIRIYDYRLTGNYFEGYMDDYTHKDIRFQLYYDGNYNWGRWQYRGYSNRAPASDSTIINHMGGKRGTNYYATGKFAERMKSLDSETTVE